MNHEEVEKMIDNADAYDEAREDTLRSMISSFYSRKMLSTVILVWVSFLVCFALAVASAVLFFRADQTRDQILYAALFVCFMQWSTLTKIFAWQTIHKNSIKREIKRLEIRVAEVQAALQKRPG
jgi:ABC-type spermidine/putrescine transport system permease subunit I